ncbi:hypothetical protein MNBD_NITROSPINAE01-1168 [hydrothermal vent metagenome]|uniref:Transglutaminase-like domain-containing protein n=1 Tax=hydrothermal vent metagenome TaxID=652676 RepID=A0A3B1BN55_9ZZZZ
MNLTCVARFLSAVLLALCVLLPNAHAEAPSWLGRQYETQLSETWMNVSFGKNKIGFSHQKIEKGKNGYRITSRAVIRLNVMGISQDMSFSRSYYLDNKKDVLGFISLMKIQNQRQQTVGTITGNVLKLSIKGAGGENEVTKKLPKGVDFAETFSFKLADQLKVGMRLTVPVYMVELRTFAPMTLNVTGKKKIKSAGGEVEVFVIDVAMQGFTSKSYVTQDGVTVREEQSMMGMVSEVVDEATALSFPKGSAVPVSSLITFSLVKPDKPIPDAGSLKELNLVIGGIKNPSAIPEDDRQIVGSPEWVKDAKGGRSLNIPVKLIRKIPQNKSSIKEASALMPEGLRPTPEIQADNAMIKKQAKKIIGNEIDAFEAAKKIRRWVFKNLKKELSDSITAIDVLRSRKGECQSHTNLFTALARSVGIPTRTASGIVYSHANDGFLYHAWPEVYISEWIPMDPTLGQDVADVTHLKLAQGGVESQLKLISFIGKITVSVRSFKK